MSSLPAPYTANPLYLLWKDVALFFSLTFDLRNFSLLSIFWPLRPTSSRLDELAPTKGNIWAIGVHIVLILLQLAYLGFALVVPLCGVPSALYFGVLVGGIWSNKLFCNITLNGLGGKLHYAGGQYATNRSDERLKIEPAMHPKERWVFVNGVAVG